MGKILKLNTVEIEGIRKLFQDGRSLGDIQDEMPKNKVNLVADLIGELEVDKDAQADWDEIFEKVTGMMRREGMPDEVIGRIVMKAKSELNFDELDPDPSKLYMYCVSRFGGGNLISNKSEGGRSGVFSMNAGAASPKLEKKENPVKAGIFKPNG